MKFKFKALTALVLLASSNAFAAPIYQADDGSFVDLYGRLGFNITNKGGDNAGRFDGRFGFSGRQAINDKMAVIGLAQYQVNAAEYANNLHDNSKDLTARYVWAGLDLAEYGKLTGGRVSSGLIMFTDIGDVFASSDVAMGRQANFVDPTAVQVFRQDGTVQYQNAFGDIDVSAAYILGNDSSDLDYGYNAAVRYTLDMGSAGKLQPVIAGQKEKASHDETSMQANQQADEYSFWGVGTRYYIGDVMLGVLFAQDRVTYRDGSPDSVDKDYETTAVWSVNEDWALRAGYRHLDNEDGDGLQLRDTTLEVQYKLTPRSSIYTSYSWRNGKQGTNKVTGNRVTFGGSNPADDYYHVGLRYEF